MKLAILNGLSFYMQVSLIQDMILVPEFLAMDLKNAGCIYAHICSTLFSI